MSRQIKILIGCIVLNLAQYNLWQIVNQHWFFYTCESVQYFLLGTIVYYLADLLEKITELKKTKKQLFYLKLVATLWIIFAVNDLCDLIFFNPNVFGWNEIFFCGMAFIITALKLKKAWNRNHNPLS